VNLVERAEKQAVLDALRREQSFQRLRGYKPYPKQKQFHAMGLEKRERALIAANQVGKTWCAGAEVAMHLTGDYPDDWPGLRFDRPTRWTAGSESAELTKKGMQRVLLGPPEDKAAWGTGMIPRAALDFDKISPRSGVPDAVMTIGVRHKRGGTSVVQLNSYDQGRTKWQADTLDGVWLDEEPPEDIYNEALTRTNVSLGPVILTATPLKGLTRVMNKYLKDKSPGTGYVNMVLEDASHYSPEQIEVIIASYPAHERDARTKGIPVLGSGVIYPIAEQLIKVMPFPIPPEWKRIAGMDFGATHPTAAVWLAIDSDADMIYVTDCYRKDGVGQLPMHASAIRSKGEWIPMAWPGDGMNETAAGPALAQQYRGERVNMRAERAQFPPDPLNPARSVVSVEAGLQEILTLMETGRFKVFSHLEDWFEEFRMYHRDNGKIVKKVDDLMDATRYAFMDRRFASTDPKRKKKPAKQEWHHSEHAWMAS
jgi:phage terminase large subunit-like protein